VPDSRTHRGPHPEDEQLFAPSTWGILREATRDLCWLLSRGYVNPSALALVGDRFRLTARQRRAVERSACSIAELRRRLEHRLEIEATQGTTLWIDGYNVLTTVEAALGGGIILAACDSTYRDMASMHGHYRKVAETLPALYLVGESLSELGCTSARWLLDRPVSNSGRLKKLIEQVAAENGWHWSVELVPNPDPLLIDSQVPVATADSIVLDYCHAWVNLSRWVIQRHVRTARVVDLAVYEAGNLTAEP